MTEFDLIHSTFQMSHFFLYESNYMHNYTEHAVVALHYKSAYNVIKIIVLNVFYYSGVHNLMLKLILNTLFVI